MSSPSPQHPRRSLRSSLPKHHPRTAVTKFYDERDILHEAPWFNRVSEALRRHRLSRVQMILAPLHDYGEFDRYDILPDQLPPAIALVSCDGPPGSTRGGRVGLFPVLGNRLGAATVLLDDADRPGEQAALAAWKEDWGGTWGLHGRIGQRWAVASGSAR